MNLTFNVEQFKPVDGNVLIQPGSVKKIRTVQYKTDNAGIDPKGEKVQAAPEVTYERMPTIMRIGKVLAIADNMVGECGFEVGDWVVYNTQRGMQQKLDLLAKKSDDDKCPILMQRFEIVSKVNIED